MSWQRRHGQLLQGAARILHHLADLALGLGVRVEHVHVDAVERESRHPSPADDPAAYDGDKAGLPGRRHHAAPFSFLRAGARFLSLSRLRTSSGPTTDAPMFSTTFTARSTSCALVANTPRER